MGQVVAGAAWKVVHTRGVVLEHVGAGKNINKLSKRYENRTLTLNALLLASTPTATGPALATAASKLYSSPRLIWTFPEMVTPLYLES